MVSRLRRLRCIGLRYLSHLRYCSIDISIGREMSEPPSISSYESVSIHKHEGYMLLEDFRTNEIMSFAIDMK